MEPKYTVRVWSRRPGGNEVEHDLYTGTFDVLHAAEIYAEALQGNVSGFRIQIQHETKVLKEYVAMAHRNKSARANQVVNCHHWVWKPTKNPIYRYGDYATFDEPDAYKEHCYC